MDDIEQYTPESAHRLQETAERLADAARQYADDVKNMSGRTSERARLFELNLGLAATLRVFNDRTFDHTGTFPLHLRPEIDDEDLEDLEDPQDGSNAHEGALSVISRWDLGVVSIEELLAEGRAAHRRVRHEEAEDDALIAIPNSAAALYAILEEAGEPWFDLPGVEVLSGARAYVAPTDPIEPFDGDPDAIAEAVQMPEGRVLFSESW